jgi:hypothetical protein
MTARTWRTHGVAAVILTVPFLVAACGLVPAAATPVAPAGEPVAETIEGFALAGARALTGDQFHRLEATARDEWQAAHPNEALSAFEVRASDASADPSGTPPNGPDDYLVMITVAGTHERHVLRIHCDPATFPAIGSCS